MAEPSFILQEDGEGDVVIANLPLGRGHIEVMAEVNFGGRIMVATGVHPGVHDLEPAEMTIGALRTIAMRLLEEIDHDELVVEGADRTTGARPGRRSKPLWFKRTRSGAAEA
jgi:hypothetical protein